MTAIIREKATGKHIKYANVEYIQYGVEYDQKDRLIHAIYIYLPIKCYTLNLDEYAPELFY